MRLPSNWRKRIEIEEQSEFGELCYILKFKKGKTPKGFGMQIGFIEIDRKSGWVSESRINLHFRRRGLGTMIYEHALKQNGRLSTSYHDASDEAQRVWKSLCKRWRHKLDFFAGTISMKNERL